MNTATTILMMCESRSTADGIAPAKAVGSIDVGSDEQTEQKPIHRTMHVNRYASLIIVCEIYVRTY